MRQIAAVRGATISGMDPTQMKREDPVWVRMAAQAQVHYRVPGMDLVQIQSNLTFTSSEGQLLEFDLYHSSSQDAAPRPCVILIHGGPVPPNLLTTPKDWGLFQSLGRMLSAAGFTAIMFNHRFFGLDMAQQAMADVQD